MNVRFINEHNEIVNEPNEIMVVHDISSQKTLQNIIYSILIVLSKLITFHQFFDNVINFPKALNQNIFQKICLKINKLFMKISRF